MRRYQDTAAAVTIVAIAALVFAPWLFGDRVLYWGDIGLYFHPMSRFLQANLSRGVVPLWNPEILCGTPYVGNPQTWPFYPSTLLLPTLGAARYLIVDDVLHITLAGLFAYWLLRAKRNGLSAGPALLGAMVYMLGGAVVSKAQFPNMLQAIAWVPVVVLFAQGIVMRPGIRSASLFGFALGLQVLSAHAQIVLMTLYLSVAYALFTLIDSAGASLTPPKLLPPFKDWWPRGRPSVAWAAVGGIIGAGVSCVAWLPVIELWRHAERQVLSMDTANRFYLPYNQLTNFALPFLHGSPYFGNWTARGNFWETACYLGVAPCLLIIAGSIAAVRARRSGAEPMFWLFVFAACVWLALGKYGGLYLVAFHIVPGLKAFHDPGRFLMGTALSGAMLTAYGAQWLLTRFATDRARAVCIIVLVAVTACDLGWFDRHQYPTLPLGQVEPIPLAQLTAQRNGSPARNFLSLADAAFGQSGSRLLMLDSYEPWRYYVNYKNFHGDDNRFMDRFLSTETPNLPMASLVSEANGYEPVAPRNAEKRWDEVSNRTVPSIAMLNDMSARAIITYRTEPIRQMPTLIQISSIPAVAPGKRVTTYVNVSSQPRARFHESPISSWQYARILADNMTQFRQDTYVSWRQAVIVCDEPDELDCVVPPTIHPSVFVLADTDYPGWYATVNGVPTQILPTATGFRELLLPPGLRRVVKMNYRPGTFVLGLYVSLVSLGGMFAVLIGTGRWSRHHATRR